jgi:hypothetical protein
VLDQLGLSSFLDEIKVIRLCLQKNGVSTWKISISHKERMLRKPAMVFGCVVRVALAPGSARHGEVEARDPFS